MARWQVNLRGRSLFITTLLAHDEERRQQIAELRDYLGKVAQFSPTDRGPDKARDVIVARNQLLLGELLAQDGHLDEAATQWRAVVTLMQALVATGDLDAMALMATAQLRLGAKAEANVLAQRIEASAYRHPAYANLVRMLAEAGGAAPGK